MADFYLFLPVMLVEKLLSGDFQNMLNRQIRRKTMAFPAKLSEKQMFCQQVRRDVDQEFVAK